MPDPDDIAAWQRLDARITTSGYLTRGDPARLKALGVACVINLAMPGSDHALDGEATLMEVQGLAYVAIPVPFDAPEEAHFAEFCKAMERAAGAPVHVHCIANWRVSAFFYRWNRLQGMNESTARSLMIRQWDPVTSPHPSAPAWARFVEAAPRRVSS
ncbi:protein tyrosine phosphatase family protein [Novosphingobium profundi]|uniref:protein tyrosine phosphatase family protein n=1 Tax=Novosphingobium profundi TaxID=1774954 RepID=UPI001BD926B6|nr:protein tyrosine phosphatase family protein [Novosphingobium profundi]MBT0670307.1 protein tyrosine phosphatase family protein [Novosphingobium profundi]